MTTGRLEALAAVLRRLHADGEVADALVVVDAAQALLTDVQTTATALGLLDVAQRLDPEPPAAALACVAVAKGILLEDEQPAAAAACDIVAGEVFDGAGAAEEAEHWYRAGLEAADAAADPQLVARGWLRLGTLLRQTDRAAEAVEPLARALALHRRQRDAVAVADTHLELGRAHVDLGREGDALEPYAAAAALYREFGRADRCAVVDDARGEALCALGRYAEAETAHAQAAAAYRALDHGHAAARSERRRSHPLHHLGRHAEAIAVAEAARGVLTEVGDDAEVAACDAAIGAALLAMGQAEAARSLLVRTQAAFAALERHDDADWCALLLDEPDALHHGHGEGRDRCG
jgi:tetratricopeptide (TPR) repeat protein